MKRLAIFLILVFLFSFKFAQGEESASNSFLSPIEVKNIIVNADGENHFVAGSFVIKNRSDRAIGGIAWKMILQEEPERRADKSWTSKPPAELFEPSQQEGGNITLSPGEEKNINFSINFSPFVKSSLYDLFVSVVDATGRVLGGNIYSGIALKGSGEALDISRACLLAKEGLKLDCEISNPGDKTITLYPSLVLVKSDSNEKVPPQPFPPFI